MRDTLLNYVNAVEQQLAGAKPADAKPGGRREARGGRATSQDRDHCCRETSCHCPEGSSNLTGRSDDAPRIRTTAARRHLGAWPAVLMPCASPAAAARAADVRTTPSVVPDAGRERAERTVATDGHRPALDGAAATAAATAPGRLDARPPPRRAGQGRRLGHAQGPGHLRRRPARAEGARPEGERGQGPDRLRQGRADHVASGWSSTRRPRGSRTSWSTSPSRRPSTRRPSRKPQSAKVVFDQEKCIFDAARARASMAGDDGRPEEQRPGQPQHQLTAQEQRFNQAARRPSRNRSAGQRSPSGRPAS